MTIQIEGASEHNLQNIDVTLPTGLTVVTGVSGSGKSSLVFDTLYHEARRRFLDIFALGSTAQRLAPARVRAITGLGPAVAVGQNLLNRNPASTLATTSGLHPFLRLLYTNFGQRHCTGCGALLTLCSEDVMVERLVELAQQPPVTILAPLLHQVRGSHRTLLALLAEQFGREALLVNNQPWSGQPLAREQAHSVALLVAELDGSVTPHAARAVLATVQALGASAVRVQGATGTETLSSAAICTTCGAPFVELAPVHFHTPCPHCQGTGCDQCEQTGLTPQAAAVRWQGLRLPDLLAHTVDELYPHFAESTTDASPAPLSTARLRAEISRRLAALQRVGLGYLTLNRSAPTLSRGEAQRVRLAVILTSRLEDMLHILDEPTVGQHPADVLRLLPAFRELAGSVVYVEHDRLAVAAADHALDLGPAAGKGGGQLLYTGSPAGLWAAETPSGHYFSGRTPVRLTSHPRPEPVEGDAAFLTIRGAHLRTLRSIDVPIPCGRLTVVTGVSGSGKSTLVRDVLVASLIAAHPVGCQTLDGPRLDPVLVDQSPIGQNPRSNPATYTNLANFIRDAYAAATGLSPSHFSFNRPEGACSACNGIGAVEVKLRYLPPTWLPCAACKGQRFSEEVLAAPVRFGDRVLSIADFYALAVDEALPLLATTPQLAPTKRHAAQRILTALQEVGLGYLALGQPLPTLSGGEAQRVKLAKYLGDKRLDKHLLVLDEPSTGLHPQDVAHLLTVLDRLVCEGATLVVVEHNTDIIRAADWVVDLGPGAGPDGGHLLHAGSVAELMQVAASQTAHALYQENSVTFQPHPPSPDPQHKSRITQHAGALGARNTIAIHGARAHNLKNVSVTFPKGALTVVTGVSGSGKSSLVHDVLEAEAQRRFLETLSLYERQSTHEGPEAPVEAVQGLGVAITVGPERRRFARRATVGTASEIDHHLAVLFATVGQRACPTCGVLMSRDPRAQTSRWCCPVCQCTTPVARPHHFSPTTYAAACTTCHGVGTLQAPQPDKVIIHPELPLCGGALYSPGFFPQGFLCQPYNSGYDLVQAVAARYGFDPMHTPWNAMSPAAQQIFLFGDQEPLTVTFVSRTGRTQTRETTFPGFYGWIRDWDVGGTYTRTEPCPACHGAQLRPDYLAVTINGHSIYHLRELPLAKLAHLLAEVTVAADTQTRDPELTFAAASLATAHRRLRFLVEIGLGYLHLNRVTATLSAGEAQRVKLAGLLGSGLTSLTVLLDEPSRGLHPTEVEALLKALQALRDEGNTVIVVEHELSIIGGADYLIDMGPGAGLAGGQVVAQGTPIQVATADTPTGRWLRDEQMGAKAAAALPKTQMRAGQARRVPQGWLTLRGACANNLHGEDVKLPLGLLVGVCGVSGSGKSTLLIDTLGRVLAPKKQTTSVAHEPIAPGPYSALEGAPARTIIIDQSRAEITNPADFLGLTPVLRKCYAAGVDAQALGLDEKALSRTCSTCHGRGTLQMDMGFLPDLYTPCDACQGTGYPPEAWTVRQQGLALPELFRLTLDELYQHFGDQEAMARPLAMAQAVGLGYLVLRQPGYALSGGEAQRLKVAKELCRKSSRDTLYLLDEPTIGQHAEDVARLTAVLHRLVAGGYSQEKGHQNTVIVIEHHSYLLAACDWLLELGPGGGPAGGHLIASGPPETIAAGHTPTAPYLRAVLACQHSTQIDTAPVTPRAVQP